MEKFFAHQIFIATFLLLLEHTHAAVILKHPVDVEAVPNEWVQFNCTVTECNSRHHFRWYIAGRSQPIRDNDTVPGLVFRKTFMCTSSNQMTHILEVQATKALNMSAFYCGAFEVPQAAPGSCRCAGRWCYSTPALLIVNTTATPSLTTACIPEKTPILSPSCTAQGVTFTEIIMMTSTVTVSVTPTPTNVLNSGPTTCLNMQKSSTQVVSVEAAVLVGWAVAASILLV